MSYLVGLWFTFDFKWFYFDIFDYNERFGFTICALGKVMFDFIFIHHIKEEIKLKAKEDE